MTIQDLGSVGELIAAVATVATLVCLAIQIRANTTAMRAEGRRANLAAGTQVRVALAKDAGLAGLLNRGLADFDALTPEEKTRFAFLMGDFLANAAAAYQEVTLGVMSESEFEYQKDIIKPFLRTPGGRAVWERFGKRFSEAFGDYVARKILPGSARMVAHQGPPPNTALQLTRHSVLQSCLVAFGYGRPATCTLPVSGLAAERQVR